MKRMKYVGTLSEVNFQDFGNVKRGETIELPDEVAESVKRANPDEWEHVKETRPGPARKE